MRGRSPPTTSPCPMPRERSRLANWADRSLSERNVTLFLCEVRADPTERDAAVVRPAVAALYGCVQSVREATLQNPALKLRH